MDARKAIALGLPVVCLMLMLAAVALRGGRSYAPTVRPATISRAPAIPREASVPGAVPAPKVDADYVVARATERERVRATLDNYRTAVATGNATLRERIRPVLLRDRELALELAREQLDKAASPMDHEVSWKVMTELER